MQIANKGLSGDVGDIQLLSEMLWADAATVNRNDLSKQEATLVAQAATLNILFAELARRAAANLNSGSQYWKVPKPSRYGTESAKPMSNDA